MHSPLENRCLVPQWLHVKFREQIPGTWTDLLYEYIGLVDEMYRAQPRAAAVLETGNHGGRLLLRFRCRPAPTSREDEVLRGIGFRLSQLSVYSSPVPAQPAREDSPQPAGWTHTAAHTVDFDLDDYIADRIERALRPQDVAVFDWGTEERLQQCASARDGDHARRTAQALKRLVATGPTRPLAKPPTDWAERLDQFQRDAPNFGTVLHAVVRPHLALCELGIRHRMPPILLLGPPGIGKTRFAHALATLLGVPPPLLVTLAEETNGSALGGSSTFWSNSSPGKLFETLAWGSGVCAPVANPLVVLDEIDKRSSSTFDPLGALYGLLEADTARCFSDQSIPDVLIDASHVRIICTANEITELPEPLQSRLMIFRIEPPTQQQLVDMVASIHLSLITGMQIAVSTLLPDEVVQRAVLLSPRIIKTRLETCIAHAVLAGRSEVQLADWEAAGQGLQPITRRRIGFIWT